MRNLCDTRLCKAFLNRTHKKHKQEKNDTMDFIKIKKLSLVDTI